MADPGTPATRSPAVVAAGRATGAKKRGADETLRARLAEVQDRIATASRGRPVEVVAVTKGLGLEAVRAAVAAGIGDLGENYAQDLLAKLVAAPPGTRWHFLGAPQTNKIARLAPHVAVWEAVDRQRAGEVIARRSPGAAVFLEVNITGDGARAGCRPDEAPELVDALFDSGLDVRGLMVIGPAGDPARTRTAFAQAAALNDRLGLEELSMGMSDDYEEAVRWGATTVRLGRALFGPRPSAAPARR